MKIEVIKDDLNKDVYRFYQNGLTFLLNDYVKLERKTKRHGWRVVGLYERLNIRRSNVNLEDVPFTDEMVEIVRNKAISEIKILKQRP